jgi:hypothetical protein
MSEVIVGGPLEELELADEHGLQPYTLGHLRLRAALAPSPTPCLWKIGERALADIEALELLEKLRSRYRREAVARSRRVHQLAVLVVPEHQRVERLRSPRVASDDELLPSVHPHFHPRA